ncbi:hypothetical protein IPF86_01095 [Candidatus Nomurabacteria bacterium]|jgi:hypothetical protein|nr:MAG: hypothetical protein IPF86_01095 [Candidatus Nomurabacteria bacterium]
MKTYIAIFVMVFMVSAHGAHAIGLPGNNMMPPKLETQSVSTTNTEMDTNTGTNTDTVVPKTKLLPLSNSQAKTMPVPRNRAEIEKLMQSRVTKMEGDTAVFKSSLAARKDMLSQKFGEEKAGEIIKVRENVTERFTNAIVMLHEIATRIESRIAKVQATGRDTSTFEAMLETANNAIDLAERDLAALQASATTDTNADGSLKSKAEALRQEITTAKKALTAIIENMKAVLGVSGSTSGQVKNTTTISPTANDIPVNTTTNTILDQATSTQ